MYICATDSSGVVLFGQEEGEEYLPASSCRRVGCTAMKGTDGLMIV